MPRTATADKVERDELLEFLRPRHRGVLTTFRADGSPQMSPVTCGLDAEGNIVVSTYPQRAKSHNVRRDPRVSVCVLSDDWDGPYVQVDGHAEVLDMPDALDGLVEYSLARHLDGARLLNAAVAGAVLARVASSHLRVGSFQYARATGDTDLLRRLVGRHHPRVDRATLAGALGGAAARPQRAQAAAGAGSLGGAVSSPAGLRTGR